MAEIPAALQEIIDDFKTIIDRRERTDMLVYYADQFEDVPAEIAERPFDQAARVPECESDAYVWSRPGADGGLDLYFAVENPQGLSAKALSAILKQTVSGAPADQIAAIDPGIVPALFGSDLSMGKGQGLTGIVNMVHAHAITRLQEQG